MIDPASPIRLAVIVTDIGAAIHVGGGVEVKVKVFDLPPEVVEYIRKVKQGDTTVHLGLDYWP